VEVKELEVVDESEEEQSSLEEEVDHSLSEDD
jgi:hypothetical protein